MDREPQYQQIILTDHPQKRHGSLGNNMNIWHIDKTDQGLSGIAKSLKSALTNAPLCKLVLVTTHITKIHGSHLLKDGMAYNKAHVELRGISCTH